MQLLACLLKLTNKNKSNPFQAMLLFLDVQENYLKNSNGIHGSFRPQFFKMHLKKYGIERVQDQTPYLSQLVKYLFYFKICKDNSSS